MKKNKPTPLQEQELIEKLMKGSDEGVKLLIHYYGDHLRMLIKDIVKYDYVVDDLLQELIMKVHEKASLYHPDKGRLITWISRITRNHCFDFLRSGRHKYWENVQHFGSLEEGLIAYKPDEPNIRADLIDLKKALTVLTPAQRDLVVQFYLYGLTHTQLAQLYNIPIGTVKSRLLSAMRKMKKSMKE